MLEKIYVLEILKWTPTQEPTWFDWVGKKLVFL